MRALSSTEPIGAVRCRQRGRRPSERIADDGATTVAPHQRPGIEGLQVEGGHVELAMHLGIGGERHLEAAVEREPVDVIAAHPATDAVTRLEHLAPARPAWCRATAHDNPARPAPTTATGSSGCVTLRAALAAPWRGRDAGT